MAKPVYEDDSEEEATPAPVARPALSIKPGDYPPAEEKNDSEPAKKAPVVTKEQLAASGLSLRDYLNKQQGLTRRGSASSPMSDYSNEGRGAKTAATPNDRAESRATRDSMAKSDLESGKSTAQRQSATSRPGVDLTSPMSALRSLSQGTKRGGGSYASGGSVSSASKRADGIATKGKTRGTMIMCGGGMTKR
jgi:hypothetical protein